MKHYKALVRDTEAMRQGFLRGAPHVISRPCNSLSEFKAIIKNRGLEIIDGQIAESVRFDWIVECSDNSERHWRYQSNLRASKAKAEPFNTLVNARKYDRWLASRNESVKHLISPCLHDLRPQDDFTHIIHTRRSFLKMTFSNTIF